MKTITQIMQAPMSHLDAAELSMGVLHINNMVMRLQAKRKVLTDEQRARGINTAIKKEAV